MQAVSISFEIDQIVHTDLDRLEAKRRRKTPGILIDLMRWLHSLGHSQPT